MQKKQTWESSSLASTRLPSRPPAPTPSNETYPGENITHCGNDFCVWWHDSGEINTNTPVAKENVRQSHRYIVKVALSDVGGDFFDSFVYESIPRNGNGMIQAPWDPPNTNTYVGDLRAPGADGISLEHEIGATMAWTQIEYNQDIDVKILRRDGISLGTDGVIIRPTTTSYYLGTSSDGGLIIRVPRDENGRKFSVEFAEDLYTYRSDGDRYVRDGGNAVGVEPTNALLIFASPFLPSTLIPPMTPENTHTMVPGPINEKEWGTSQILYFPPGVYWMNSNRVGDKGKLGENHIILSDETYWVHFASGAYVKGAIQYSTTRNFYATGHGVLSGEHYVYQANVDHHYTAIKSDGSSLRLWTHGHTHAGQTWTCKGPTIANPPFNTMDFHGGEKASVQLSDYNQVGAWFMQTDGPQMYPNSTVHDVFYHANDDAIKTTYSEVSVERATVWKVHNDPVIQMGWDSRDVHDVSIKTLNVIHTRFYSPNMYVPSAIIGASPFYYQGCCAVDKAKAISITVEGLRCEGICPSLFRINPLQNYNNFVVRNVDFPDGLQAGAPWTGRSIILASDGVHMGIEIKDWKVGGQKVTMDNFQSDRLGQLDIDLSYWGQWKIS